MSSSWSAQIVVVEVPGGEGIGRLALENDVGLGGEPAEVLGTGVRVEVEHYPALRRVVVPPPEAALGVFDVVGEGPVGPARVAAWGLDDDHVGAEVAELLAREGGVFRRQLDHPQSGERPRRLGPRHSCHVTPSSSQCSISASRARGSPTARVVVLTQAGAAPLDRPVGLRQVHGRPSTLMPPIRSGAPSARAPTRRCRGRGRSDPPRPPPPRVGGAQRLGNCEPVADRPRRHPFVERIPPPAARPPCRCGIERLRLPITAGSSSRRRRDTRWPPVVLTHGG